MALPPQLRSDLSRKYYRKMRAAYPLMGRSSASGISARWAPAPEQPRGGGGFDASGNPTNPGTWLLDILSQPNYALGQTLGEASDALSRGIKDRDPLGAISGIVKSSPLLNFGDRNDKQTISDFVKGSEYTTDNGDTYTSPLTALAPNENDNMAQKIGKGAAGFAMDVALDPTTYIGLGAVGGGIRGIGQAVGREAVEGGLRSGASKALTAVGEGAIKADDAINRAITKPFRAISNRITNPARQIEAAPLRGTADRARAAAETAEDSPLATFLRQSDEGENVFVTPPQTGDRVFEAPAGSTQQVEEVARLRDPETGLDVPNTAANRNRKVVPNYRETAPGRVTDDSGRYLTPFAREEAARANPVPEASVAEELASPTPVETTPIIGNMAEQVVDTPQARLEAWIRDNQNTELSLMIKGVRNTYPVSRWLSRAAETRDPAIRQAIHRNLAGRAMQERPARLTPQAAPETLPGGTERQAGAPITPSPARESREAAEAAREAGASRPLADAQWIEKPRQQKDIIRKRWQRLLEEEHFRYLYDDYIKDPNLSTADKAKEFDKRVRLLMRGKATTKPRYEAYFEQRVTNIPPDPTAETVIRWTNPGSTDDALSAALGSHTPIAEMVEEVPGDLPSTRARLDEVNLQSSADTLEPHVRESLRDVLGEKAVKSATETTGQQWNRIAEGWHWRARRGAQRNSPKPGEGFAINREAYNAKAQANLFTSLITKADADVPQGLAGYDRARFLRERIMKELEAVDNYMRANGVQPVAGNGMRGIPISAYDMIRALEITSTGRDFVLRRIFGGRGITKRGMKKETGQQWPGTFYIDSLLRSSGPLVQLTTSPSLVNAIRNGMPIDEEGFRITVKRLLQEGRTPTEEGIARAVTDNFQTPIHAGKAGPVDIGPKGEPLYGPFSKQVIDEFIDVMLPKKDADLFGALREFVEIANMRARDAGVKYGDTTRELTDEVMSAVYRDVAEGLNGTNLRARLTGLNDEVGDAAKEAPYRVENSEKAAAQKATREGVEDFIPPEDMARAESMGRVASDIYTDTKPKAKAQEDIKVEGMRMHNQAGDEVKAQRQQAVSLEQLATEQMDAAGFWGRLGLRTNNAFVNHLQFPTFHAAHSRMGTLSNWLSESMRKDLTDITRMGTRDEIKAAYKLWQQQSNLGDPKLLAIKEKLGQHASLMWNTSEDGILSNFLENGHDLHHIISKMNANHYGLTDAERFVPPKGFESLPIREQVTEFLSHFKNMDVQDPVDFLARMDSVMSSVARDASFARESLKIVKEVGGISSTPKPGFVRVKPEDLNKNIITRYWPGVEDVYIDKSIALQLKRINDALTASANFSGDLHGFMRHIDPFLAMWKSGMTIWRVGHHVRNLIGDMSLAFLMDGVKNPAPYYKAMRMLGARNQYEGVDILRMVNGMETRPGIAAASKAPTKIKFGGREMQMSNDELYDALAKRGLFKTFSQGEDIITATDTPEWIKKFQSAIQLKGSARGRAKEFVGTASEMRDDMVRLAHAIDLIEKGKISPRLGMDLFKKPQTKNFDEFLDEVVKRVNQTHPDGSDLTSFERKVMRRLMPFYSWTRKAIPLVIEGTLMHPGRITVYPKFMYNMAQQLGVNPDSLSDPFPNDQLFPSYLSDSMTGPLYRDEETQDYYGITPGVADQDVLNMLLSGGPTGLRNELLNMVNPMIKTGPELLSGSTWGAGIRTPESSPTEYLGRQIPGLSQAQSISGYDILGSVLNGQPTEIESVERGNRETWGRDQILNWFLGAGHTNMSTPTSINVAEMEARDKARAQNSP